MAELKLYHSPIAGVYERWPKLPITPQQLNMWMQVRTSYVWSQPCLTDVWFSMMADTDKELAWFTDRVPVAATDDQFAYINPETFFSLKYTLLNRVFIMGHEIVHNIFNHCGIMWRCQKIGSILYPDGVKLPFDIKIAQKSTDCLVNDLLVNSNVGEKPKDAWHLPKLITYMDDFYGAYRKFYQDQNDTGGGRGRRRSQQGAGTPQSNQTNGQDNGDPSAGDSEGSFDVHLAPGEPQGKTPFEAEQERDQQAWDNAVRSALQSAKGCGKLPAALDRGLSQLLTPRVTWQEHLHFSFSRKMGNETSTWEMLDNEFMLRGIGAPGRRGFGCRLVIGITDDSGSINDKTAHMFFNEFAALVQDVRPQRFIFMQVGCRIDENIEVNDPTDLVDHKMINGLGTDFRPPFDWIDSEGLQPDCVVYLTDLDGPFPQFEPSYPVIWGSVNEIKKAPWGETIYIPQQVENQ